MPASYECTVEEAAAILGVRVDEIYRLIRSNRIAAAKVGSRWQINIASVNEHKQKRKREEPVNAG